MSSQDTFKPASSSEQPRAPQLQHMFTQGLGQVGGVLKQTNQGLIQVAGTIKEQIQNQYLLDDSVTDQDKKDTIDFKRLLTEYRERTEDLIPHTMTRVEDVMFIDENRMIALEYVFYNKDGKYFHLKPSENMHSELGVKDYTLGGSIDQDHKYKFEHLNAFQTNPKSFQADLAQDYLSNESMFINNGADDLQQNAHAPGQNPQPYLVQDATVEALISLWAVDSNGSISKDQEKRFQYDQRFSPSRNGKMMLFLSTDKERICFGLVDPLRDDQIQIKAWRTKDLQEIEVSQELNGELKSEQISNSQSKLQEINFVNSCKHLLCVQKTDIPMSTEEEMRLLKKSVVGEVDTRRMMQFNIFKESGERVFQFQNFHDVSDLRDSESQIWNSLKCLYMLVSEPYWLKESNHGDSNDIEFVFFFSAIVAQEYQSSKDFNEVVTFVKISLSEIKSNSSKESDQPLGKGTQEIRYIFQQAVQKFDEFERSMERKQSMRMSQNDGSKRRLTKTDIRRESQETPPDFFLIPQSWFTDPSTLKPIPWHDHIQVGTNNKFEHFGFLNRRLRTYLAFDNISTSTVNRLLGKKIIYDQNIVTHMVRNQQTKRFLYLMTRGMLDGCTAYCFMSKDTMESVKFQKDHLYSCQDVHAFRGKEGINFNFRTASMHQVQLQSCTISKGDQQILLNTTLPHNSHFHAIQSRKEEIISRKTINQRFNGHFPLLAYNIGLHRIIFQNTQKDKESYHNSFVFDLEHDEKFISFVEYNTYADIGFVPASLKIEMCSNFVFLVYNKRHKKILIKMMLIDPYYDTYQFVVFTSKRSFSNLDQNDHRDVVIRSLMVSKNKSSLTQSSLDLTLVTQFTDDISQHTISEFDHSENHDQNSKLVQDDFEEHKIQSNHHVIQFEESFKMAKVPIIQNQHGQIFYVLSSVGNCQVKMIDPHVVHTHSKDHMTIFELKAEECLAFYMNNDNQFYFIDENKLIIHLTQNNDTGFLEEKNHLMIKDKDMPNLEPSVYATILIEDSYLICGSKIFYLQSNTPLENGILDMEDLSLPLMEELEDEDRGGQQSGGEESFDDSQSDDESTEVPTITQNFVIGPIKMRGSNQFLIVLQTGQTVNFINETSQSSDNKVSVDIMSFRQRIFQLPDTSGVPLISDQEKQVKFSTFLDSSNILIQIGHRFAIFNEKGHFKCQLDFDKKRLPEIDSQLQRRFSIMFKKNTNSHMELICMSSNNKYFLFADLERKEFRVWQWDSDSDKSKQVSELGSGAKSSTVSRRKSVIGTISKKSQIQSIKSVFQLVKKKVLQPKYFFSPKFVVDLEKSNIFKDQQSKWRKMAPAKNDHDYFGELLKFVQKNVQVRLTCQGCVNLIQNTQIDQDFQEMVQEKDLKDITIRASLYFNQQLKNLRIDPKTDQETLKIEVASVNEKKRRLGSEIKQKQNEIDIEWQYQNSLPSNFQDHSKLSELTDQRHELEHQQQEIINSYIVGEHIVVVCGRHIKYAKINTKFKEQEEQKQAEQQQKQQKQPTNLIKIFKEYFTEATQIRTLQKMKIAFNPGIEIYNILETSTQSHIQIVAKDIIKKILLVVTWDLLSNIEVSMFQLKYENDQFPENYIVAGLSQKMNYFFDVAQIYDLQNNIPIQESFKNLKMNQIMHQKYAQCRKVYQDSSRFLGLEQQNLLNFPLTRMDILLWKSIVDLGNKPHLILQNTELYQLSQTFDNNSLFHHFASYIDVMEMIHERFKDTKLSNGFGPKEENIPLILLSQNKEGKTALDIALETQRLKSFELMIDLLEDKDEFFLTQMMLNNLPQMISMSTELILKFFSSSVYESPLMEMSDCYPWSTGSKEEIFACHTTFISDEILLHRLAKSVGQDAIEEHLANKRKASEELHDGYDDDMNKEGDGLTQFKLDVSEEKLHQSKKRIKIEALDLSWVFKQNKAKQFLIMLADSGNSSLYIQKSIRVFIKIMWQHYQRKMVHLIFMPYVVYFMMFTLLCSEYAGEFLDDNNIDMDIQINQSELKLARRRLNIMAISCITLMIYFLWVEFMQFKEVGLKMYLKDYWNYFDVGSIILNFSFLTMLYLILEHKDTVSDYNILDYVQYVQWVRLVGAMNVIIMYIKLFYWMRLFKKYAYFITLLSQTISDIKVFLIMLFLVICSFANFFFILNYNTPMNDKYVTMEGEEDIDNSFYSQDPRFYYYVKRYVKNNILSSIISVYLTALGDFDTDGLGRGYYRYAAWGAFILSTFVVLVVFMNLLIAIMGDSFSRIQPIQEQAALYEQLQLIKDYIWILDLEHIFEGKKYIIRLYPDTLSGESETEKTQAMKVNHVGTELMHSFDENNSDIIEHQGNTEKSIVSLLKTLDLQMNKLQQYYENQQTQIWMEKQKTKIQNQSSN